MVIAGVVYAYDYEVKLKEVIASFLRDEGGIRVINYVLKTDGIVVECGKETMLFKWGEVISVDVNPYGVYVILSNQTALMLPERFFRYNQKEEFLDEVDRQVFNVRKRAPLPLVKAKDRVKLPKKNPSLFFYAFTLLSFIPLLGFFIGAVVVMFGVWDYRNKTVVAIGVAGMLFTIGFYSYLTLSISPEDRRKAKIFSAQVQLNNVVEALEAFQRENKYYPDKLEDLSNSGKRVYINDPIVSPNPDSKFAASLHYEKHFSGYKLFSVGIDQTPNTPDDINPTLRGIGLISD